MTLEIPPSPSTRAAWLALVALAAACGGADPASPPEAPAASLAGELRPAEPGTADGPLRLALAWYPGLLSPDGEPISRPGAVVTRDVAYTGTLPLDYTFDALEAPPAGALSPLPPGYAGEGAVGILLVYQDGDGDRKLDTIPADGAPIDHVVGASLEWAASPAFLVVYLTHAQPAATGLAAGFNLVRITGAETSEVVPLATSIPITVSEGGPLLDLFVCEAAWDGSGSQAPCGLVLDSWPSAP